MTYTYDMICNMDDADVIDVIRLDDEQSESVLDMFVKKHKDLVRKRARKLYLVGGETEDLIQEGMIGLYKAILEYKRDKNVSFAAFADTIIYRHMCNTINAYNRKKNVPLNDYISLNQVFMQPGREGDDEKGVELIAAMEAPVGSNPEDFIIDKENADMIESELVEHLSKLEREVYFRYVSGDDYRQIAVKLGKSPKAVDNALQRIRSKCMQIIE